MIDVHILELLASKICHDLISPIGAINNGIEFMEDMGPEAYDDAKDLIAQSATQASAKLQAYRLAYGAGGADYTHTPKDVFDTLERIVELDKRTTQSWDPQDQNFPKDGTGTFPRGYCKILTMTLLLILDSLPKGGTIAVTPQEDGKTIISATGPDSKLKEGISDAVMLQTDRDDLHPKLIHGYVCGLLSEYYGHTLTVESASGGHVSLALNPPQ